MTEMPIGKGPIFGKPEQETIFTERDRIRVQLIAPIESGRINERLPYGARTQARPSEPIPIETRIASPRLRRLVDEAWAMVWSEHRGRIVERVVLITDDAGHTSLNQVGVCYPHLDDNARSIDDSKGCVVAFNLANIAKRSDDEARYTVLHELAHALLSHDVRRTEAREAREAEACQMAGYWATRG